MAGTYSKVSPEKQILSFATFAAFPTATGSSLQAWDEATQTLYIDDPGSSTWAAIGGAGAGAITGVLDTNSIDMTKVGIDVQAALKLSAAAATAGALLVTTTVEGDGLKTEIPNKLLKTDKITLIAGDIVNKYVVLSEAPAVKSQTQLTIIGGPQQEYSIDFEVTTDNADRRLSWDGLALEGILATGDKLVVNYN